MSHPIMPGAESISITEGSRGGVLLLHGYMGTVQTVRDWAMAFARAGFSVEAPLLPGHGTSVEEQLATRWPDYVDCAENAYHRLAERHQHIFVGGLCTGGMLAACVALNHPETLAGVISVNGLFKLPGHWNFTFIEEMAQTNRRYFPWFRGKSIEDPNAPALIVYEQAAVAPIVSMRPANVALLARLSEITCPVLVFTSLRDKVVPPEDTKAWSQKLSGPVEYVQLECSNHVATLDYDKGIIETRSVEFALAVTQKKSERSSESAVQALPL